MTSNLGSELIQNATRVDDVKEAIEALLKATFKPEFLNRIDDIITFNRLSKDDILKIVHIQLADFAKRLAEKKLTVKFSKGAIGHLADAGFDPLYGARPLKRTIQSLVQNPIAKMVLSGDYKEGDTIVVDKGKEGLTFKSEC
jgi:ATP-dependent Clp protease ATP-binding subunit ClpB